MSELSHCNFEIFAGTVWGAMNIKCEVKKS
jgi:hypothetical protein